MSFFKWLLAVWHDFYLQDGCLCNICCVLVFFQASLSGECETMIWEVHYYQQIAGLFGGENLQQHHRSASTSTYTNWSLAYISSCIPHRKCKEMNELVFYSPLSGSWMYGMVFSFKMDTLQASMSVCFLVFLRVSVRTWYWMGIEIRLQGLWWGKLT